MLYSIAHESSGIDHIATLVAMLPARLSTSGFEGKTVYFEGNRVVLGHKAQTECDLKIDARSVCGTVQQP
jgi:hypothetical protein